MESGRKKELFQSEEDDFERVQDEDEEEQNQENPTQSRDPIPETPASPLPKHKKKYKKGRRASFVDYRKKKRRRKSPQASGSEGNSRTSNTEPEHDNSGGHLIPTTGPDSESRSESDSDVPSSAPVVSDAHKYFDSDNIVESTSDFETGTEETESEEASIFPRPTSEPVKSKKRSKSKLTLPRKGSSNKVENSGECKKTVGDGAAGPSTGQRTQEDLERDAHQFCQRLVSNLTLLLPSEWSSAVVRNHTVRAIKLNDLDNAAVVSSIFWNWSSASYGLFVNGMPLSQDSPIIKSIVHPEAGNIGSIADFILRLVKKVDSSKICCGVTEFQELWHESRGGFIDNSPIQQSPCLRSVSCTLLVSSNKSVCWHCNHEQLRFERNVKRKDESNKPTHVSDNYCTKEEIKIKKDFYKTQFRKEKLRADRMEKRLENMQVKLDAALRDELTAMLVANENKMTDLQKTFWESQRLALAANDRRGIRWHPMLVRIALHLHSKSASAYEYLQETGILQLPSTRRLYDYSHFIDTKEGCQQEIISDIKRKIDACGTAKHFSFVNLMFDEMHIRAGLVTKKSTGELIGFTNLEDTEKELLSMQAELENKTFKPRLAKKVLVYMVQGITCESVKDVVAIYSTDDLCAVQLYNRSWEVIYNLEDACVKVLTVTCDGAATNRKFINMHFSRDKNCKFVYSTVNLKSGDFRPLYFIIDPPHLLKTVRNCIANSFRHRKTRQLWKNGEELSWQVFETLYQLTKDDKFRTHKLSQSHIKLNNFSCMTVLFATQTLSGSVADSIEDLKDHESMKSLHTSEIVKLTRLMNRFFDCMNGKEREENIEDDQENLDRAAYRSSADRRFDFLENEFLNFFEDWKKDVKNREGEFSQTDRNNMLLSHQSLEALVITVKSVKGAIQFMLDESGASKVNARVFNQDPLEQYFGKIRRSLGDNRQPFLQSVLDKRLNIHAQGSAALPPKKGNTTVVKRSLEVDSSPVPVMKKSRKNK